MRHSSKLVVVSSLVVTAHGLGCEPRHATVQPTTTTSSEAQSPAGSPVPASTRATGGVLPAGASIMVRLVDPISTEISQSGAPFQARLASAIRDSNGSVIAPEGTAVFGRVVDAEGGGMVSRPRLEITLTAIEVHGRQVPLVTTSSGAEGGRGGAVKKIGAGTLIGAAAGSAGAGAAIGGAAVLLGGGKQIAIATGTLVEFKLTQQARLE